MTYFRIHTADKAYLTQQPRGIFAAVSKLIDAGTATEEEAAEYRRNREHFEKALPVPPFYGEGNPDHAVTWFKYTPEGQRIWEDMSFYRRICAKYGVRLYISECDELPGEVIYEDGFQIAVKNQREDLAVRTREIEDHN